MKVWETISGQTDNSLFEVEKRLSSMNSPEMSPARFCLMGPREFCCGRDRLWNLWETGALDLSSVDPKELSFNDF